MRMQLRNINVYESSNFDVCYLCTELIDSYAEMLLYERQIMSVGSTNDENSYIFSTLCLYASLQKQLTHHLDVEKSMGGKSCKTMRGGMVKSFVNDLTRSFVDDNL
ncbi:hypothetical protein CsSME_00018983 [Camellia sinensis var. sinensis]